MSSVGRNNCSNLPSPFSIESGSFDSTSKRYILNRSALGATTRLSSAPHTRTLASKITRFFESVPQTFKNWKTTFDEANRKKSQDHAASKILNGFVHNNPKSVYQGCKALFNKDVSQDDVLQLLQDAADRISYQNLEKARSGVPDCGAVLEYSDKNTFYHRMLEKFEALGLPCGDAGGRTKRIENTDDKIRCINWIELKACLDRQAVTNMSHGLFDHVLENAEYTSDCTTVFLGGVQTYSKKQKMSPGKLLIDNANHYLKESKFLESDIFDASDKVIKHWPHSQIRFEDGGQTHLTMHTGASEKAGTKTRESVDFVNNFTGSREATKVLSCFLNRQGWHDISTKMVNGNGDRVELHLDPADSSRSERQPVDRFRDAEINVSKTDEGNYKVVFDWTLKAFGIKYHTGKAAYFGRLGGSDVDQGSTLLVEVNSEITISADAAKKGELKLLNEDFKHRFSESLVFDHNDEQSEHATSMYDDDSEVYLYQHVGGFGFISETFSDSEQD